jgi:serine/threonine protein kinase
MPSKIHIGRYQLERKLGEGSYAEVWLAQDTALERLVALKVLKPVWMADEDTRGRFMREARTLANLHHPRIAWVWDLGEADGRAFLALRYVNGPSLDQILRKEGRLDWQTALRIATATSNPRTFWSAPKTGPS